MTSRRELIDAIDGYYVALVLDGLHRAGVLRALADQSNIASIARRLRLDRRTLIRLLRFVSHRSTVVRAIDGQPQSFVLAPGYNASFGGYLLDQYVGAYGPCLRELPLILRKPATGRRFVDTDRHADAFAAGGPSMTLVRLIEAFDVRGILDIGCGGGQLLAALARRRANVRGVGLDANVKMVRFARKSMRASGLARRVDVVAASVSQLARMVPPARRKQIDAICAVSVANEFFATNTGIDALLRRLRALFPARLLFLSDYYSRLDAHDPGDGYTRTLVHDVAQMVSGQGLPPDDLGQWHAIYARNRVTLLQSCVGVDAGVKWFIHVARL